MLLGQIIFATFLAGVASMIGGIILLGKASWIRKFSVHLVSFTAGALLATAFLELLPEALAMDPAKTSLFLSITLLGIVAFFLFERLILQVHAHHHEDTTEHHHATPALLMTGDALHNFMDGVAIAAAFLASPSLGVVTALAVGLHELPQEIGDFSVLVYHGWERKKILWTNLLISLTAIAGAILAYSAKSLIEPALPHLLSFTAGIFIYIAASDLIPEIPRERLDKNTHVILLLVTGAAAVWVFSRWLGV